MYARVRIVVSEETNKDLLALFIQQYDRMDEKAKAQAPVVVTR